MVRLPGRMHMSRRDDCAADEWGARLALRRVMDCFLEGPLQIEGPIVSAGDNMCTVVVRS